jgi:tellurite resistance protein TerC
MQRTKHFLKIILGFTLLTMGAAMFLLPGPGWLTIGLGLMVLAAEFAWARRLLNRLRGQALKVCGSVSEGTRPKKSSGSC